MKTAGSRSAKEKERGFFFFLSVLSMVQLAACCLLPILSHLLFPRGKALWWCRHGCSPGKAIPNFAICDDLTQRAGSWWRLLSTRTKQWQLLIEEEKALKSPAENVHSPKNRPVFLHGIDLELLI